MKKIFLLLSIVYGISVNGQELLPKSNNYIPLLDGLTTKSKLQDFKSAFSTLQFKEEVKPGIYSYTLGELSSNEITYKCSAQFDQNENIVLIRFVSEISTDPEKPYKNFENLLDSNLEDFEKINQESNDIFLKGVKYKKENTEYWLSILKGFGDKNKKTISLGVRIEPLKDIIKRKEFRERSEALQAKYGKEFAPLIHQGLIAVGMTKEMVFESIGEPDKINNSNYQNNITEQLVYNSPTKTLYIYLKDEIVIGYQENEK